MLTKYQHEVTPTKRGYRWEKIRIDFLLREFPDLMCLRLNKLHPHDLAKWRDARLRQVKSSTVLREFGVLSTALEHARIERGWLESNPARDIRKPPSVPHRERVISWSETKAVLRALGHNPRLPSTTLSQSTARAFLLALHTGMRLGEICGLTWERVGEHSVFLPQTKTVPREVPITTKAARVLAMQRKMDAVSVFVGTAATVGAFFAKARKTAGLQGFTFHDARHTAATRIVASGRIDVLTLCKMFGWSNTTRALTYYNPRAVDIAAKLNAK